MWFLPSFHIAVRQTRFTLLFIFFYFGLMALSYTPCCHVPDFFFQIQYLFFKFLPSIHLYFFFYYHGFDLFPHLPLDDFSLPFPQNRNPKTVTGYDSAHQCSKHTQAVPFVMKGHLSYIYQYDSYSRIAAIANNWCHREFKSVNEIHSVEVCCNYAD